MNENSFYEQLLQLPNVRVEKVEIESKRILISCHISMKESACESCGKKTTFINQHTSGKLQDLSIVGKEVILQIQVPQFYCKDCKSYFAYELGFADANKSYTHGQSKWIFELCNQQPFTEVGALVNLSHHTVENIYFQQAEALVDIKKRFQNVRKIGIDEISHRKGKGDYCCVLTDLELRLRVLVRSA